MNVWSILQNTNRTKLLDITLYSRVIVSCTLSFKCIVRTCYTFYMKATWNNTVIAEAPHEDLIRIEGNWYFPPSSIKQDYFKNSDHHTTCPWKGEASYYDIVIDGKTNEFGAWYYPHPNDSAIKRVNNDFSRFVAFWNGVTVSE